MGDDWLRAIVFSVTYRKRTRRKMGRGATSDTFSISGPKLLNPICWNNWHDITVVVACLVMGVSTMQRDKAMKREALANPWYESFGFSLLETLINPDDSSIYGAVYMYKHYDSYQKTPLLGKPPLYVIAFRGTMLSSVTWKSDMKQNKELLDSEKLKRKVRIARSFIKTTFASLFNLQIQEDDPRTRAWTPYLYVNPRDPICLGYINDFILKSESGPARISVRSRVFGRRRTPSSPAGEPIQFLSSADMTVNKTACIRTAHKLKQWWKPDPVLVARNSLIFEAKSSNPVDVATRALKLAREWITAGWSRLDLLRKRIQSSSPRIELPRLRRLSSNGGSFSNATRHHNPTLRMFSDNLKLIRAIDHDLQHRNKMFKIGTETIERIATRNSLRSLLSGEGGGSSCSNSSSEPLHLLPSAYMTIKTSQSPDFKRAHGILCSMVNMFCTSLIIEFHFCSFKCLKKPTPIFELN
ncbi:hypothetical protein YC2023_086303 [Brassica napus]